MKKIALVVFIILSINIAVSMLTMIPQVRANEIDDLIKKLGDDEFWVRYKARTELIKKIEEQIKKDPPDTTALKKVREAMHDPDPEVRQLAQGIVKIVITQFEQFQNIFAIFGITAKIEYKKWVDPNDPEKIERESARLDVSRDWIKYSKNLFGWAGVTMTAQDVIAIGDAEDRFLEAIEGCKGKEVLDALDNLIDTINRAKSLPQECKDNANKVLDSIKKSLMKDSEDINGDGKPEGDGMPDWWEIKYGLRPNIDDAKGNPDGDKNPDGSPKDNLQEYQKDSDPQVMKDSHSGVITPVGTNVLVGLGKEIHMIYSQITEEGETDINISFIPRITFPATLRPIDCFFEVSTTSQYTGSIAVTFPYREFWVSGSEEELKLLHWNGEEWKDITTSVDVDGNTITGRTNSLSPFVVAEPLHIPVGGFAVPIDKPESDASAPYIVLASTIVVATAATAIYVKRVKRRKEKQ